MFFKHATPMILATAILGTLGGCATSINPRDQPEISSWKKLSETEWQSNLTIRGKKWNLHAIHKDDILYLRQWAECPQGSVVPTEEIITQAKLVATDKVRSCTGEYGFAFSGWFLSNQFRNGLPNEVRHWFESSPQPPDMQLPAELIPSEKI